MMQWKRAARIIRNTRDQILSDKDDMTDLLSDMEGVTDHGITDREAALAMARAIHNLEDAFIKEIDRRKENER